jgi:hypothetical protein
MWDITKDKNISLIVDGLKSCGYDIGVYVYANDWNKLYRFNGNRCDITLPYKDQEYEIRIGVVENLLDFEYVMDANIGALKVYYTEFN